MFCLFVCFFFSFLEMRSGLYISQLFFYVQNGLFSFFLKVLLCFSFSPISFVTLLLYSAISCFLIILQLLLQVLTFQLEICINRRYHISSFLVRRKSLWV